MHEQHGLKPCSQQTNGTELICTELTQFHDALLVTRVSVTKLIGCKTAVGAVHQFANSSLESMRLQLEPNLQTSYDLSCDYLKFIVRSTYDNDYLNDVLRFLLGIS